MTSAEPTRLRLKPYLPRLYLVVLVVFVANKLWIRPWVLAQDFPRFVDLVVFSLPNAAEAVYGVGLCSTLLQVIQHRRRPRWDHISRRWLDAAAVLTAGIYVLTQEFKLHHLGGRNTYDPYDVVASVLGLLVMFAVVRRYGVVEPR